MSYTGLQLKLVHTVMAEGLENPVQHTRAQIKLR
jgi:hypothetical protein